MKFLKFSIVLLLTLSFFAAGISLYLTAVRENEKEKRVQVERARDQLQEKVDSLTSENVELKDKNGTLTKQLNDFTVKYEAAKTERDQMAQIAQERDVQIDRLNEQVLRSEKAYDFAKKRNEELERILEGLEAQTRQLMGSTAGVSSAAGTAFVEMEVSGKNESLKPEETLSAQEAETEKSTAQNSEIAAPAPIQKVEPVTTPPTPKRKGKRLFPFLRSKKNGEGVEKKPPQMESVVAAPPPALLAPEAPKIADEKVEVSEKRSNSKQKQAITPPAAAAPLPAKPVSAAQPKPSREAKSSEKPKNTVSKTARSEQTLAAGSVLLINRKFNFVVANLGLNQGIQMNDILGIERDGKQIAKARVEKLYDDYCAAYLVEEQVEIPIKEGDLVSAL